MKNSSDPFDLTTATFTFKYDAWNRLASGWLTTLPGFVVSYEYDGLNRRIRKSGPAPQPGHYYYNEDWQLLEERATSDPDPRAQYVWHPYYIDALAVRYWDENTDGAYNGTNEGAQYYLQDANFNVTAVTDDSGDVIERYDYTPYGEVTYLEPDFDVATTQESIVDNTHLYTSRERDEESGLQLNRNRYYYWVLGRWNTRDPIGYDGGTSLYNYVDNQVAFYLDPFGFAHQQGDGCFGWIGYTHECEHPPTDEQREKMTIYAGCTVAACLVVGTCLAVGLPPGGTAIAHHFRTVAWV